MPPMNWMRLIFIACLCVSTAAAQVLPPGVRNSQPAGDRPLAPAESVRRITVPDGFHVTLFAGEPDIAQPIAFTFDDRGRLWIVENFSYPDWEKFEGKDRVTILEDTDNDGRFDSRKVFLDDGHNLTGIALGFGGVWLCSAPNLVFIPDRDGDDKPDQPLNPAQVKLDGWAFEDVQHNIVNGLTWGPDGWLYGCHGILAESRVGKPGTPEKDRTRINCGIWRYHPIHETFEVVARGTTNPWGLDFDDYGEGFFANCVIEHMFHFVPGGRYKRMYGQDDNPYSYALMPAASDHLHWAGEDWNTEGSDPTLQTAHGGGHAHCGTMVYLGDNFPAEFRNTVFTHNIHGNRVNRDLLVRSGSGYVARHGPDFLMAHDPWYRGVAIGYGPDGGVYLTDWNDLGECHDNDGVYRASGRIYKVIHGEPRPAKPLDLTKLSDEELVDLQLHPNDWYVRHARRILQERAAAGREMSNAATKLRGILRDHKETTRRLRAFWALHVMGALTESEWTGLLKNADEHVRAWAVRLAPVIKNDGRVNIPLLSELQAMALADDSPLVRLYLASMMQRVPAENARYMLALAEHGEDADDPNIPLMIWYGLEPAIEEQPGIGEALLECRIPQLRTWSARRLIERDPEAGVARVAHSLGLRDEPELQLDQMSGALQALRGRQVQPPPGWLATYRKLSASSDPEVRRDVRLLALALNDPNAAGELRRIAAEGSADSGPRREAIEALAERKDPQLPTVLHALVADPALGGAALRGLAAYDHPDTPRIILESYGRIAAEHKPEAIAALTSRPHYAAVLLDAVEGGRVPRGDISAFAARLIFEMGDEKLREKLTATWGVIQTSSQDKTQLMAKFKRALTPQALANADLPNGRAVFDRACAACHKLFGQGGDIGPELTGSDRANLDYVLINVIDPNAIVGKDFQLTTIVTRDGRAIAGMVKRETGDSVTIRTTTEELVIPREQIATMTAVPVSLMPEGLLLTLTEQEVRDLVAYLASPRQVE